MIKPFTDENGVSWVEIDDLSWKHATFNTYIMGMDIT